MRFSSSSRLVAVASAAAVLAACNPTFNWREVPVGDAGVIVLLPCKPDRATRQMPLGTEAVAVDMAGCKAGGATFAVAHASARDAAQAESWMRAWRAATLQQLEGTPVAETPASLPRAASPSPAPVRLDTQEPAGSGHAQAAHVLWFAQQRPDGMAVYQATVVGSPSASDALQTFFEGLRLP
ncbi:hypothetical protein QTH90_24310 [Variovorax sp. J2P1-59]|uniref:hypothetical protein n=1 Tax=Variovorax flavidus TaxID=3053501 RepID=UPI002575A1E4|nr:hypothetical protein [Variovorax sp. J2P1-59]MDM0077552.1 hypothetical protein [Variovorax sp. J2P1-59]